MYLKEYVANLAIQRSTRSEKHESDHVLNICNKDHAMQWDDEGEEGWC